MATLREMAQQFADDNDCTLEMLDHGYGGTLVFGPLRVRLMLQPGGSMLVLQTGVGILPSEDREKLALKLLAANDLLQATRGLTLGLNMDAGVITLQTAWDITTLHQEAFSNLVRNVVTETTRWLEKLSDPNWAEGDRNAVSGDVSASDLLANNMYLKI
ncbi:MAG: type III secretion system chaperone [Desulfovibrio sp.]|nr:type III secretion system chaperone [Desulfovibrio sp.]